MEPTNCLEIKSDLFLANKVAILGAYTLLMVAKTDNIIPGIVLETYKLPIADGLINILANNKSKPTFKIALNLFKTFQIPDFNNSMTFSSLKKILLITNFGANIFFKL